MIRRCDWDEVQSSIAANVRREMNERGIKQRELAARAQMSQPHISRLLNGYVEWWLPDMRRVSKALGVDMAALLQPAQEKGAA